MGSAWVLALAQVPERELGVAARELVPVQAPAQVPGQVPVLV